MAENNNEIMKQIAERVGAFEARDSGANLEFHEWPKYQCAVHGDIGNGVMTMTLSGAFDEVFCFRCYNEFLKKNIGTVVRV